MEMTSNTRKIKNIVWAICADAAATPPKPKTAAMIVRIKKMITQSIIRDSLVLQNRLDVNEFAENFYQMTSCLSM